MSNIGLVSYNKKFLYCAVGAPGSTCDARMLHNSTVYQIIVTGHAIPDKVIDLGEHGKIPFGDTAFPKYALLIKVLREYTSDRREKYFYKKLLCRVLKCIWHVKVAFPLYKKTECRLFNLKYIVMARVMLHNLCIDVNDLFISLVFTCKKYQPYQKASREEGRY